jgi:hypothetical protein
MENHHCDCLQKYEPWQEELRLRINFDKNQDREVCILFIKHRFLLRTEVLGTIEEELNFAEKQLADPDCYDPELREYLTGKRNVLNDLKAKFIPLTTPIKE